MWAIDTPKKQRRDGLKPYNEMELYANSYSIQGMVLREINMDENSKVDFSADHDRMMMWHPGEFREVCRATWNSGERGMQGWALKASKKDFLVFGQKVVDMEYKTHRKRVTGFRVIRGTNVSSGYEVFSLQAIVEDVT